MINSIVLCLPGQRAGYEQVGWRLATSASDSTLTQLGPVVQPVMEGSRLVVRPHLCDSCEVGCDGGRDSQQTSILLRGAARCQADGNRLGFKVESNGGGGAEAACNLFGNEFEMAETHGRHENTKWSFPFTIHNS